MSIKRTAAIPPALHSGLPKPVNFSAMAWYGRNAAIIQQFVTAIRPEGWTGFQDAARWLQEHVLGTDRGELNPWVAEQFERKPALRAYAMDVLRTTGMFSGSSIEVGHYQELAVTGAKFKAMIEQLGPLVQALDGEQIQVNELWAYVGHRGRTDAQDGLLSEILDAIPRGLRDHAWVSKELKERTEPEPKHGMSDQELGNFQRWGGPFESESKLFLLALMIVLFEFDIHAELTFLPLPDNDRSDDNVSSLPRREYMAALVTLSNGIKLYVLNAPAVAQPKGGPRPTTNSALDYRLRRQTPQTGTRILVSSTPVRGYRVARSFESTLHTLRPDCEVGGMWEPANNGRAEQLFPSALSGFTRLIADAYDEMTTALALK